MKKEALEILKSNLDLVYTKYYTENDNKWLWQVCGGDPFVEYKDVPDFKLTNLELDLSVGEIELENCKIIYKNLAFFNESQASDERLWAGLCHSTFYEYVRKRWGYHNAKPKKATDAISNIKSRFFFSGGIRSGLYRNTLAKCWWVGRNTFDASATNHFEKLDIIGSSNISSKISDIFYNNNFSSNSMILDGIIDGIQYFNREGIQLTVKEHIRPTLQLLNAIGGGVILDCLSKNEISDIFVDSIYAIIQGDEQGVEADNSDYEEDAVVSAEEELDIVEEKYVVLGCKISVKIIETNESKTIVADYLQRTAQMPPLVKELLGKTIGDSVLFQGKTYRIEAIS
jgi:hypothetical protein